MIAPGFSPFYFTGLSCIVQERAQKPDVWLSVAAFATVTAAREWASEFGTHEYRLLKVEVPEACDDLIERVELVV